MGRRGKFHISTASATTFPPIDILKIMLLCSDYDERDKMLQEISSSETKSDEENS
jgi:hypothetical protein